MPHPAKSEIRVTVPAHAPARPLPAVIESLRVQLLRALAWTASESNTAALWEAVRRQLEDTLFVSWRDGALVGTTAEQAFFVRCDRSTMTQNDIDNGRLIAVVGVAPVEPAEFTILHITEQVRPPPDAPAQP